MNNTQLKYARERARQIYDLRSMQIRKAPSDLTVAEKLAALAEGAFTVDPLRVSYHNWQNAIVFNSMPVIDQEQIQSEMAALDNEYNRIVDELILGDNHQALALLKAFEAA